MRCACLATDRSERRSLRGADKSQRMFESYFGNGDGIQLEQFGIFQHPFVQKATTRRFVCLQVFPQCLCKTSIATSFTPPYLPSNDIKTRHRSSTRTLRMTVTLPHAMPVGTGRIRFPYHRLPDAEVVKLLTPHSAQKPCRAFSKWFAISFHAAQI